MRYAPTALALSLCLVFACSRNEDSGSAAAPEDPAAAGAASEPGAPPMPAGNAGHDYACDGGLAFNARIDRGNAVVTIDGKTLTLTPVPGALGAQYETAGVTFIARGSEATFIRDGEPPRACTAK